MADDILYNFQENHDGLDHIQRVITDIHAMADDINKIFNNIAELWEGQTPEAMVAAHAQINQKLEDYLQAIQHTGAGASQQQEDMAALDAQLAGGF